jgi:lipopolysaccharide biosynthesis glycosyltransferase
MLKIYTCAFRNQCYLEEAKVCIESLRTNGQFQGPIYLLTDMEVTIPNVEVIKTNCTSVELSAAYRIKVFDYIKEYDSNDIFLYLDTDIVTLKPLPSFNDIDDKVNVYGYSWRKQAEHSFSGFLTNDPHFTEKNATSSGVLLFRPSLKVKKIFDEIYELYYGLIQRGHINAMWEQPSICFKLIEHDMLNSSLNDYVYEERSKKPITEQHIFNHFCGMRGDDRYKKMKKYL